MKRTLITLISILAAIYIVFSLLDINSEYAVEKQMWSANLKYAQIVKDPQSVPDKSFADLDKQYQKIVERHPNSKLSPQALLTISNLYLEKKDYQTARQKAGEVSQKYPKNEEICAMAMSVIGKSYELNGDWDNALKIYKSVSEKYPTTETGFNAPTYIATHYLYKKMAAESQKAFNEAIMHYKLLAEKHANTPDELKSLRLMANCYIFQKRWEEGVDALGKVLLKSQAYHELTPQSANLLIKTINLLSITQLKDYDTPIAIYRQFMAENPNHGINRVLEQLIKSLETLKAKKVIVDKKK